MNLDDFDFELPLSQIAQTPLERRDASRLLTLARRTGARAHHLFEALPALLRAGDLLVFNDAKVIPARLLGKKAGTGGKAELLVIRPAASVRTDEALGEAPQALEWLCIGQASKGLKAGLVIELSGGLRAEVIEALGHGEVRVRFEGGAETLERALAQAGHPPAAYIERAPTSADAERYQTIYATRAGSAAAPTAGLHFSHQLFAALDQRGVGRAMLTLDVGPGTFLPVREAEIDDHRMHLERFVVPEATVDAIAKARERGGRIIAVGTTVVRTLEAATGEDGGLRAGPGETALFIRPGFVFRQVDALVTNFHLPRSTLLMLVSAFAGREQVLGAYREAVEHGYRFFSYGDAMFISDLEPIRRSGGF